ncbi:MAG: RNA-binding S4 domain-containing protein [Gammaproteobacteria bacterium]|nr:RNA-binding S4 domain-containing protein [Gammaproteobacteria bacterium]
MQTITFQLKTQHVALCNLLKLVGLATSSGQGKALVAAGGVQVDGHAESRKTAKLRVGQVVEYQTTRIEIVAA